MSVLLEQEQSLAYPIDAIRQDFPILSQVVRGKPLAYFDNAASTQKPQPVLDRLMQYYTQENANVHRGVHWLSEQATFVYDQARARVKGFVGASDNYALIFTRGATESINLVASAYAATHLKAGDEIVVSLLEHHSNWVPWQQLAKERGCVLKVCPLTESGQVDMAVYTKLLTKKTALVAMTHVSNTLGIETPITSIIAQAHEVGAKVLVDGTQAVPHQPVHLDALDADFYVFSGHKMYAPMGIGALIVKTDILDKMSPYQTGGGMIQTVSESVTTFAEGVGRFEAGTPNVAGAVGLASACDYLQGLGMEMIADYEADYTQKLLKALASIESVRVLALESHPKGIVSLDIDGIHPHDLASICDHHGVAVRAGHHCTMPLMKFLQVPATLRISVGIYNKVNEINTLVQALEQAIALFKRG